MHAETFVKTFRAASLEAKKRGAVFNWKAACAQAALESAWGSSGLAASGNNLFGIKAGASWRGPVYWGTTYEFEGGKYVRYAGVGRVYKSVEEALTAARNMGVAEKIVRTALFRAYESWADSIVDMARIVENLWWFRDALPHADPPRGDGSVEGWIAHLVDKDVPGELTWATSPAYFNSVMRIYARIAPLMD